MLLVLVLLSALYLVRTQYESRRLYTELDRAKALAQRLDTEHDRLDVERGAQATPLRVEKLAREQMGMQTISPAITQYVSTQNISSEKISASTPPKAQP
jgi:cell division protein FtsL